jgi:hypothetical protein
MLSRLLLWALNDHNEAVYLSKLDRREKPWVSYADVLPLSVFGALFVSVARVISGHPSLAAFRKSAKKDAFQKARERGCWRTHRGA